MAQQWLRRLRRNPTLTGKTNGYFGGKKDEMDAESSKGFAAGWLERGFLPNPKRLTPLLPPMGTKVGPRPSGTSSRKTNQPAT